LTIIGTPAEFEPVPPAKIDYELMSLKAFAGIPAYL
jgi:hypothetical protein